MRVKIAQRNLLSSPLSLDRMTYSDIAESSSAVLGENGWEFDEPTTQAIEEVGANSLQAFTLRLSNPTTQSIVIRGTEPIVRNPFIAETLVFHSLLFCDAGATVSTYLHPTSEPYPSVTPNTMEIPNGRWSPAFSNTFVFGDENTPFASVSKTIVIATNSPTSPVLFTFPTLTLDEPEKFNQFSELSKPMFPDIFRDVDAEATNPSRPLAKIYHSMTADLSQAMDKYIRMLNYERAELNHHSVEIYGDPYNILSRSEITDPELMTPEYLEWGSMIRGFRSLPDVQVTSGTSVFDASFDFRRWQVQTAAFGHAAGSRDSIRKSVQTVLGGSKSVLVTPLWNDEEFNIMVRTIVNETPGTPAQGSTSPVVLKMATLAKPAGYIMLHQTVNEINFVLNDPDFGLFDISALG